MKNYRKIVLISLSIVFIGLIIAIYSYIISSVFLFVMGTLCIVLGVLFILALMSFNLFVQDKNLNIEKLKEMGLTIVECKACLKENVLEDQYCIYCGERLGSDDIGIQEEHKT